MVCGLMIIGLLVMFIVRLLAAGLGLFYGFFCDLDFWLFWVVACWYLLVGLCWFCFLSLVSFKLRFCGGL